MRRKRRGKTSYYLSLRFSASLLPLRFKKGSDNQSGGGVHREVSKMKGQKCLQPNTACPKTAIPVNKPGVEISRRGTGNPNVWWAILGVAPFTSFGTLLLASNLPEWFSAGTALAAGLCAGSMIALVAHAFCRRGFVESGCYTESMSFLGWQLWQETYAAAEIDELSIEGLYFSDEMTLPYAYRFYLLLKNGVLLPSFVFAKKDDAERLLRQVNSALQLQGSP